MADRLMLLDTASLYFRAFYGVPDTVTAPDGRPINAARGLLDMIAKLVSAYEPTHLIACWDDDWRPQWRVDLLRSYKTHRVAEPVASGPDVEVVPDPLEAQVPVIREALGVLGIPIVGAADHEADDVIGTLATRSDIPVDVVTGDRDLIQLVDDARGIRVVYTGRGMSNLDVLTDEFVVAKYAVRPDQYADFATMRGDASDGLPGVGSPRRSRRHRGGRRTRRGDDGGRPGEDHGRRGLPRGRPPSRPRRAGSAAGTGGRTDPARGSTRPRRARGTLGTRRLRCARRCVSARAGLTAAERPQPRSRSVHSRSFDSGQVVTMRSAGTPSRSARAAP